MPPTNNRLFAVRPPLNACLLALLGAVCLAGSDAHAQAEGRGLVAERSQGDGYYASNADKQFDPKVIIRQKAIARAQERAARTAAREWFGLNPARPQATATPLVGLYNGGWGVPGGRPAIYGRTSRPVYILR